MTHLKFLTAKRSLLEICRLPTAVERIEAMDNWLTNSIRDYHVQFSISKEIERRHPEEFEPYKAHSMKRAALQLGAKLLEDKMLVAREIHTDDVDPPFRTPLWDGFERRFQIDLYPFCPFYW